MHKLHNNEVRASVFGCGNVLIGDDGFGPAVIELLQSDYDFPDTVSLEDVGTGIREFLFDFLLAPELAPRMLIVLDAVDFQDRRPGEVFTITPGIIPAEKIHDFSLHQFPTVNLLQEIAEHTGVSVHIIAAQVEHIPDEIAPGLTLSMQNAVKEASEKVRELLLTMSTQTCEVMQP